MTLQWFTGNKVARHAGRDGVVAILADVSGSMDKNILTPALRAVALALPSARVFVFACTVAEATRIRHGAELPDVGGLTNMELGLEAVACLHPEQVIVLSDGCVNESASLAVADRMTGAISSLWFGTPGTADFHGFGRDFMQELARRKGGQFREYDLARGAEGLVRELIGIVRIQRIHYHDLPTEIIDHRPPRHAVAFAPTTVRLREGGR